MENGFEPLASLEIGNLDVLASRKGEELCPTMSCGSLDLSLCVRGIVDAVALGDGTFSNLLRKEETFPVTTGEGDLFLKFILVPVPVRPLNNKLDSLDSLVGVIEYVRFFCSIAGLGLLVFDSGVVHRDLLLCSGTGILESWVFCSNLSLALFTEPCFAVEKILFVF